MVTRLRAAGWAIGAAALVAVLWSVLPVWRVCDVELYYEQWSFGTLWRVGQRLPADYRDADSSVELLSVHWWNAVMALVLVATATLVGRKVFRRCRDENDEPTRLGWGLDRLASLRRQGALLARGRTQPHPRRPTAATRELALKIGDRPLSETEHGLIRWLLEHGTAEATPYLEQLNRIRVAGQCPCGCPTVDLAVGDVQHPAGGDKVILADYQWQGPGDSRFGVYVFARSGLLAGLAVWAIEGHDMPSRLPEPAELRPLGSE
jgi:hypothetical protein